MEKKISAVHVLYLLLIDDFYLKGKVILYQHFCLQNSKAGVRFDNYFFDNYFDFVRQLKNGSFLSPVFVHVTGRSKN